LPVRQFVVSSPYATFEAISDSLTLYQQMIEVEQISAVLKNVSFADTPLCRICGESHPNSDCPEVRPVAQVVSAHRVSRPSSRDREYKNDRQSLYSPRRHFRSQSRSPSPYRGEIGNVIVTLMIDIRLGQVASLTHLADTIIETVPTLGTGIVLATEGRFG
jgi:hypothetical protein